LASSDLILQYSIQLSSSTIGPRLARAQTQNRQTLQEVISTSIENENILFTLYLSFKINVL